MHTFKRLRSWDDFGT